MLKNLHFIDRNLAWLKSELPTSMKFSYYPNIIFSYARYFVSKNKHIKYLGRLFQFDNIATPLNLQAYPGDIKQGVINNISIKPKYILDIGGNIGQFAITTKYFLPNARIDIFEPNPEVYSILEKNTKEIKGLNIFNLAISKGDNIEFYFEPNRSATGSFLFENASDNQSRLKKILVKCTSDIQKETGRSHYDLVKIDVEGFEYDVIKLMKNMSFKYLFIEFSGVARTKKYSHSQLLDMSGSH
jgi:FkbM family methyltransferase